MIRRTFSLMVTIFLMIFDQALRIASRYLLRRALRKALG